MKINEHSGLSEFINTHLACTIAVPIDTERTVHIASLVYWNSNEPLEFYFVTSRQSEKYKLLKKQKEINCAVVVGTENGTPYTLQMRGKVAEVSPAEHAEQIDAYHEKRGNKHDNLGSAGMCLLRFIPTWARFTDYSRGYDEQFLDVG